MTKGAEVAIDALVSWTVAAFDVRACLAGHEQAAGNARAGGIVELNLPQGYGVEGVERPG
jgi:hypothetical protein